MIWFFFHMHRRACQPGRSFNPYLNHFRCVFAFFSFVYHRCYWKENAAQDAWTVLRLSLMNWKHKQQHSVTLNTKIFSSINTEVNFKPLSPYVCAILCTDIWVMFYSTALNSWIKCQFAFTNQKLPSNKKGVMITDQVSYYIYIQDKFTVCVWWLTRNAPRFY